METACAVGKQSHIDNLFRLHVHPAGHVRQFQPGAPATIPAAPRMVAEILLYSFIVSSPLYLMCVAKKRTTNFIIINPPNAHLDVVGVPDQPVDVGRLPAQFRRIVLQDDAFAGAAVQAVRRLSFC